MTTTSGSLPSDRFTPYQRRLFIFLSVATFFEGYDFMALTQILPELAEEMNLQSSGMGALVGFINAGTILALLLVRSADKFGRRRVLTWTIAGYTTLTFLTGFSPNIYVFAVLQMVARIFLIGEWATSMVIAAEEFPAKRRGMVMGVIQAFSSLGSIACAGIVPVLILNFPRWGWRSVYFMGVIPLIILAYARRGLKETKRFTEQAKSEKTEKRSFFYVFSTPYRKRLLQLGIIWFMTYLCTQNGVTFWKTFAVAERGFTKGEVGQAIVIAAIASMPMVFFAGRLLDWIGRRKGAVVIYSLGALGILGCYSLHGFWPLTLALVLGIFGASAVAPVLNAYTTELFPTDLRGDAFAWSNNLLGRIGYVLSPFAVGIAADKVGWGLAVGSTSLALVVAVVLILAMLPETNAKELEETARI